MVSSTGAAIVVIGAGVSGLTTAICLAEEGYRVRVFAAAPPLATTSALAGASWGPYMVDDQRVLIWSNETLRELESLSADPDTGVQLMNGMEASTEAGAPPAWAVAVRDYRECDTSELPAGFKSGWRHTIPLINMPRYLSYLAARLARAGVDVEVLEGPLGSFAEVSGTFDVLVNCTGLGARQLVPDEGLYPTRGQLVVVENPGVDWFFQDDAESGDLTYFLPHGDHVVLGGSAVPHWSHTEPDPEIAAGIIERCAAIEPKLADAKVIKHRIGFRPSRKGGVRVEREDAGGRIVIHNYGHSGSGVTLSWGCAREVLRLVAAA